jgi:predicted lipid-binding transport protein (Tim44 family)
MKREHIAALLVCVAVAAAGLGAAPAEDSLASARDLYAAAEYEDALGVLNRILTADHRGDDVPAIDQYRAFCLLALGRTTDAEQAIEGVVAADPFFQPSADVSPRVRSAFTDVRRRMLPAIAQDRYATAKAAFDRKDFVAAETGFKQVLDVLSDPDVGAAAGQPPLADIRTLAAGFRDLSAKAIPPPPLPAVPTPEPPAPAPRPAAPQIFGPDDAAVVPPAVVHQDLPSFEYQVLVTPPTGSIEIVIDERGHVETATIRKSILPRYDTRLLEAARAWQYKPATLNGVPVKYRKIVNVSVKR